MEYVYLAIGCGSLGVILTFVVVLTCRALDVDLVKNLWIISIPVILSIVLNIAVIELYSRYKRKK